MDCGQGLIKIKHALKGQENIMKLTLISASIVAYAALAAMWICDARLTALLPAALPV